MIFSADYEEQYVINIHEKNPDMLSRTTVALIQGVNSLHPCPVCLVHEKDMEDITLRPEHEVKYQTHATMRAVFERAHQAQTAEQKEAILKASGLRDIEVRCSLLLEFVYGLQN